MQVTNIKVMTHKALQVFVLVLLFVLTEEHDVLKMFHLIEKCNVLHCRLFQAAMINISGWRDIVLTRHKKLVCLHVPVEPKEEMMNKSQSRNKSVYHLGVVLFIRLGLLSKQRGTEAVFNLNLLLLYKCKKNALSAYLSSLS